MLCGCGQYGAFCPFVCFSHQQREGNLSQAFSALKCKCILDLELKSQFFLQLSIGFPCFLYQTRQANWFQFSRSPPSALELLDAGRPKWELKVQKYQILKLDNNTTTLRDPMKELQKWELDFYESARIQWEWIILTINIYSFIPTWSVVTSDITGRIGHFVCSISWMWTNAQLRWTLCNLWIRRIPAWGGQQILFVSITQKFLYSSKVQFLIFLVNFVQNKVIESYYSEMEHLIQLSSFSLQPFSELNHISFDEIFSQNYSK